MTILRLKPSVGRLAILFAVTSSRVCAAFRPDSAVAVAEEAAMVTVFMGAASGPDGWAINDKAAVTAVTAGKQKVTAKFGYDSVNETVIAEVERALKSTLEK